MLKSQNFDEIGERVLIQDPGMDNEEEELSRAKISQFRVKNSGIMMT